MLPATNRREQMAPPELLNGYAMTGVWEGGKVAKRTFDPLYVRSFFMKKHRPRGFPNASGAYKCPTNFTPALPATIAAIRFSRVCSSYWPTRTPSTLADALSSERVIERTIVLARTVCAVIETFLVLFVFIVLSYWFELNCDTIVLSCFVLSIVNMCV